MNNQFVWGEIKLPSPYYIPGTSFAEAWAINPSGNAIIGTFGVRPPPSTLPPPPPFSGEFHGFFKAASEPKRELNGYSEVELFGSYDFPFNPGGSTSARGINDNRDVVGFFRDEKGGRQIHSYVWPKGEPGPKKFDFSPTRLEQVFADADGKTPLDATILHNALLGINEEKLVVGVFRVKDFDGDIGLIAPIDNPDRLVSVEMGAPDALDLRASYLAAKPPITSPINTTVTAINSKRAIVGFYTDITGTHGFKWKLKEQQVFDGTRFFDGPAVQINISLYGAGVFPPRLQTWINGINDLGWIVGSYQSNGIDHGFVWKPEKDGSYAPTKHITIDIVGATHTVVSGISNKGTFVGHYRGNNIGGRHAFAGNLL